MCVCVFVFALPQLRWGSKLDHAAIHYEGNLCMYIYTCVGV